MNALKSVARTQRVNYIIIYVSFYVFYLLKSQTSLSKRCYKHDQAI